jgi:serine O-acetyltransferase
MEIVNLEAEKLANYCCEQLRRMIPFADESEFALIGMHLPEALKRLDHCIGQSSIWAPGKFDILHSSQYCTFLYYLANTIWRREKATRICTMLFLLNKSLNSIDLFYEIEMPEVFCIGHSVGIVLAKATYGNYLVLYQNSTVGKNHGVAPVLEDGVVLYPNSAVIGRSRVARGSLISQGTSVINRDTQTDRIVFQGQENSLVFKPYERNILADFFRGV